VSDLFAAELEAMGLVVAPTLRDYQTDAVDRLRELVRRGIRKLILQATTGAGKTVMAGQVMSQAAGKGSRSLFLAHSRELVQQASEKLTAFSVPHGLIMAGQGTRLDLACQVASKDTLVSWALRRDKIALPPADLVVVDECHRSISRWWQALLNLYPRAVILGLSATPVLGNGKGLGSFYGGMVQAAPNSVLLANHYLVPTEVFAPFRPDLKGVQWDARRGEFNRKQLEARMDRPKLVGDVVRHWKQLAADRLTLVFASGVGHSIHLMERFQAAGVAAAHIDGSTDTEQRDYLLREFRAGRVRVLCNCNVFVEGLDVPEASCAVNVKPTRSMRAFLQMCGRTRRWLPGKPDALLIDHASGVFMHGFPDVDVEWGLDPGEVACKPRDPGEAPPIVCPRCYYVFRAARQCPRCGHQLGPRAAAVEYRDGQLVKVRPEKVPRVNAGADERQKYWHYCLAAAAHKGRDARGAAHQYKQRFGRWPGSDGLRNVPADKTQWRTPVAELFPQYLRAKQAGRAADGPGLFD
jgi:DNA repair protein RadD